jgi:hypothetical protein
VGPFARRCRSREKSGVPEQEEEMPGKHERWLLNARVIVIITALAVVLVLYEIQPLLWISK